MKHLALCTLATAVCAPAIADNYQAEIGIIYANIDYHADGFNSYDVDSYALSGEVYFSSVTTEKGPLAEASFLDHASGISASWIDLEDADDDTKAVGLRYVTEGDFIIEALYTDDGLNDTFGFGLGWYLYENSDLVFSYSNEDDTDMHTIGADFHSVANLEGDKSIGYSLGAYYSGKSDLNSDAKDYGINGDITFYVNNQLGYTAVAQYNNINDAEITSYGLSVDYFIVPNFHISALYLHSSTDFDFYSFDADTTGISASVRF